MSRSVRRGQWKWYWTVTIFLVLAWASSYPGLILGYILFTRLPLDLTNLVHIIIIILFIIANYFIILILALVLTGFIVGIIDLRSPPRAGTFDNKISDPYLYNWRIKNLLRSFTRWLWEMPRIDALRKFYLRVNNIKIGKNVRLGKYILEDDFLEIGDGTFMGKNSIISGHLFDPFKFTTYKTKVGKNCIFSNWSGTVGTNVPDNTTLIGKICATSVILNGYECEEDAIYRGVPAKKIGYRTHFNTKQLKNLKRMIKHQERFRYFENTLSAVESKGLGFKLQLFLGKVFIVFGGITFSFVFNYLYISLIFNLGFPTGDFTLDCIMLIPIPPLFIVSIGFWMGGLCAFTRLLMTFHFGGAGVIKEGEYDLNDPILKKWKLCFLWKDFSLRLANTSPLAVGSTMIYLVYLCKLNRNVQMTKASVDPEFIYIGKNTNIAALTVVRTHYLKDNKMIFKRIEFGENVMIGSLAYIGAGTKIGNNTVIGIGAYIPENSVCESNSLYIGNPARRLPLTTIKNKYEK